MKDDRLQQFDTTYYEGGGRVLKSMKISWVVTQKRLRQDSPRLRTFRGKNLKGLRTSATRGSKEKMGASRILERNSDGVLSAGPSRSGEY